MSRFNFMAAACSVSVSHSQTLFPPNGTNLHTNCQQQRNAGGTQNNDDPTNLRTINSKSKLEYEITSNDPLLSTETKL
jgi:hypothetical protein